MEDILSRKCYVAAEKTSACSTLTGLNLIIQYHPGATYRQMDEAAIIWLR